MHFISIIITAIIISTTNNITTIIETFFPVEQNEQPIRTQRTDRRRERHCKFDMQTTASAEQHEQPQPRAPATEAPSTSSGFSIKQYSHGNGFFDKHKHTIYKKALEEMKLEAKESNAIGGSADDSVSDEEMFKRLSKKKRRRLMKRAENHVRKAVGEPKRKRIKATMRANKIEPRGGS